MVELVELVELVVLVELVEPEMIGERERSGEISGTAVIEGKNATVAVVYVEMDLSRTVILNEHH